MNDLLMYKGYAATVIFDADAQVLFGKVLGLRDVITFQADSAAEVRQAFEASVDDYLEFCAERGEQPERAKSGKFNVRVDPETHRFIEMAAEKSGLTMNKWIGKRLREDAEQELEGLRKG